MLEIFSWLAVLLALVASGGLLLARDWRWQVVWAAAQYLALFTLTLNHWPLSMAAATLVSGWMAAAMLGISRPPAQSERSDSGRLFQGIIAAVVLLAVTVAAFSLSDWLGSAGFPLALGALILVGLGLLQLGMTSHPGRITWGLLTTLAGFETLFSALENSILVAVLLSAVTLGLALAGAYLLQSAPEQV